MNKLVDPNQTTLSELTKYDGLIVVEGTGNGNVRFKGSMARKPKPSIM